MSKIGKFPDNPGPQVALVAAGAAELQALAPCAHLLREFGVAMEQTVLSATEDDPLPQAAAQLAREAPAIGLRMLIVACADARLSARLAALTRLPVIRIPAAVSGSDATAGLALLLGGSREQADSTGGFATVAIGEAGAKNAALFAISVLALDDARLRTAWQRFREEQTARVLREAPLA